MQLEKEQEAVVSKGNPSLQAMVPDLHPTLGESSYEGAVTSPAAVRFRCVYNIIYLDRPGRHERP